MFERALVTKRSELNENGLRGTMICFVEPGLPPYGSTKGV
jgi:hypothetical protein